MKMDIVLSKNQVVRVSRLAMRGQRGFALGELLLALAVVGIIVAGLFVTFTGLRGTVGANDVGDKIMMMVADIQKNWRTSNSFATVSAAEINKLSLIRSPLNYDGTNLKDGWGNVMSINGSATSFALTIGGSTFPIQQDDCASLVARLSPVANAIRIGADAAAAGGAISGGSLYKSGATITQSGLTTGCSASNPIIAAQFRF
ncbi:prepilin-type N-terminal cleavage/methylation domain-containing protein [Paracidovorax wautersii]|uniref:Prepilin-type N-terminal cleavage/methylation domain-containing protein n=1 Tax=Paracidovorax wautersii TaxID=1177982 RepID=A0A1I2HR27_9BURK|nr:prepilin-type N-terminal cleavage/methylation domain-containing protein [Paracidovorax wautersii]SFF31968.1 prepilin-type N-terminal cleavage/methylation domain-containing protein [Paracidovorax wautersii]